VTSSVQLFGDRGERSALSVSSFMGFLPMPLNFQRLRRILSCRAVIPSGNDMAGMDGWAVLIDVPHETSVFGKANINIP